MTSWRPARQRTWLDLTPLIDVVFTLLLFVVVTAQFTPQDSLALTLPTAELNSPASDRPVAVSLARDGTVRVDGSPVRTDEAAERVKTLGRPVLLRADAEVAYSRVFEVMAALGKAGITDIGLAYEAR